MRSGIHGRSYHPHSNSIKFLRISLANCRIRNQSLVGASFSVAKAVFSILLRVALHVGVAVAGLRGVYVATRALQ